MYIIKITQDKVSKMADYAETMLRAGGKLMQCLDEMQRDEQDFGERRGMGMRGGYRESMPRERFRDEDDDDMNYMGERRGVRGTGRYGRY